MLNKHRLRILIAMISLALLGLIVVQVTLIHDNVEWRKSQFKRSVNSALANVSEKLEWYEALSRVKQDQAGNRILERLNEMHAVSLAESNESGQIDSLVVQIENGNVMIMGTGRSKIHDDFIFESDDPSEFNEYVEFNYTEHDLTVEMELVEELVTSLSRNTPTLEIRERIQQEILDSLIREELKIWGIDTDYQFAVVDIVDRAVFCSEPAEQILKENVLSPIQSSGFSVKLFSNDLFDNPHFLKVNFPNEGSYLLYSMLPFLMVSMLFLMLVIGAFYYTIHTIMRQKKLSEIRNDFISNMTHELKTPISTISLACEALNDPDMRNSDVGTSRFVGMIKEENNRLGLLVENVLKTAILDKGQMKFKNVELDVHYILEKVVNSFDLQLKSVNGHIDKLFQATDIIISGDKIHLTNVFYNLIDNAIKYSKSEPSIVISTWNEERYLKVTVTDNGIGITAENQKKIFDQLFRVPTGNVHDVKGFGLGLHYVKVIIEKHGGQVFVDSTPKKGSTFTILLPKDYENKD